MNNLNILIKSPCNQSLCHKFIYGNFVGNQTSKRVDMSADSHHTCAAYEDQLMRKSEHYTEYL